MLFVLNYIFFLTNIFFNFQTKYTFLVKILAKAALIAMHPNITKEDTSDFTECFVIFESFMFFSFATLLQKKLYTSIFSISCSEIAFYIFVSEFVSCNELV